MKNYISSGEIVSVAAPYARESGEAALVGSLFGVSITKVALGETMQMQTKGIVKHTKVTADVVAVGDKIYWDNTNKILTTTATSNKWVGVAVAAAGNTATEVELRLNGFAQ